MMSPLAAATALFPAPRLRPWRRRGLLLSLLTSLGLAGCNGRPSLPNVIYLALSTNNDQTIDAFLLEETRARIRILEQSFRQIHPESRFQFSMYQETQISKALIRRSRAGLGPDLIFVNGVTAEQMLASGVVDPFPATPDQLRQFDPDDLDRLRNKRGELAGLPVFIQTQLACFNRKRLPKPPANVADLLAISAAGHPVGMTVEVHNLYWSAGSLGASDGINNAIRGNELSPTERQAIVNWLGWLQNASSQQRVTFYGDQQTAVSEFLAGRIDWTLCNSITLPRLRKQLGSNLGVSVLPKGTDGNEPSPLKRLRVFALGSSSSMAGRSRAIAFARFSTNPLMQRALTVGSQTLLPANRFVKVPIQSSQMLEAMERSNRQSDKNKIGTLINENDPRIRLIQNLITELVFGEVSAQSSADSLIHILRRHP